MFCTTVLQSVLLFGLFRVLYNMHKLHNLHKSHSNSLLYTFLFLHFENADVQLLSYFFPTSYQIEELYEAYCLQRRLRDGANKMVMAYTAASPGSKEAKESLVEANKGYKEYTEVR